MCIGIGAKYATITGLGFQHGATPGALMEELSVIRGNVEQFCVATLRAGQVRFCYQFHDLVMPRQI
jgi:hypothetical protein